MHETIKNLNQIDKEIKEKINLLNYQDYMPKIIAVSKTFKLDHISPLINFGHVHFGENKVQEAQQKWSEIKEKNKNIKLHMIGKLQTNKVKFAVKIFDFIHSVDSFKLVKKIAEEQSKINKNIKVFIQVNLGDEAQKSGIQKNETKNLLDFAIQNGLEVIGLMCLPPFDDESEKYFKELRELNSKLSLNDISMGMSHDFIDALKYKSSYLRIGSKIFGKRG